MTITIKRTQWLKVGRTLALLSVLLGACLILGTFGEADFEDRIGQTLITTYQIAMQTALGLGMMVAGWRLTYHLQKKIENL